MSVDIWDFLYDRKFCGMDNVYAIERPALIALLKDFAALSKGEATQPASRYDSRKEGDLTIHTHKPEISDVG